MIETPWNIVLTLAFVFTGAVCIGHFISHRARAKASGARHQGGPQALSDGELIDINHVIMSAAMILMVWISVIDVVTWAQIALFVVVALSLVPSFGRANSSAHRFDLAGHVFLDGAMIWMLAAMPLLMAGMSMEGEDGGAHHHGGDSGDMLMATPAWADVVNVIVVAGCALLLAWWLYRAAVARGHRLHAVCHAVMAAGMGGMLLLMNA